MTNFSEYLSENYKTVKCVENEDERHHEFHAKSSRTWNMRHTGIQFRDNEKLHTNQILFVDFGEAFVPEMGFGHPALLMKYENRLCKVLPITSSGAKTENAYHPLDNPNGNKAYYKIPKGTSGLTKDSCVLVRQSRTISESRILKIIDEEGLSSSTYSEIRKMSLADDYPEVIGQIKRLERDKRISAIQLAIVNSIPVAVGSIDEIPKYIHDLPTECKVIKCEAEESVENGVKAIVTVEDSQYQINITQSVIVNVQSTQQEKMD